MAWQNLNTERLSLSHNHCSVWQLTKAEFFLLVCRGVDYSENSHRKAANYKGLLYGLLKSSETNQSSTILHLISGLKNFILLSVGFLSKLSFPFQWHNYFLYINSKTDKAPSYVLYRYNFNYFMFCWQKVSKYLYMRNRRLKK